MFHSIKFLHPIALRSFPTAFIPSDIRSVNEARAQVSHSCINVVVIMLSLRVYCSCTSKLPALQLDHGAVESDLCQGFGEYAPYFLSARNWGNNCYMSHSSSISSIGFCINRRIVWQAICGTSDPYLQEYHVVSPILLG